MGETTIPLRAKEALRRYQEWHEQEKIHLGERRYAEVERSLEAAFQALRPRLDGILNEALARGFNRRGARRNIDGVLLEFSNDAGAYYRRSVGYFKHMKQFDIPVLWDWKIADHIVAYALNFEGFCDREVLRRLAVSANSHRVTTTGE
jgi:hypothetical protein